MARIVLAKLGSDAHDLGVTAVARGLREGGHEVVYAGLYNPPERVAQIALQEDADLVGVSCLSSDPVYATRRMRQTLEGVGLGRVPLVVGGVVTPDMKVEISRLPRAPPLRPRPPRPRPGAAPLCAPGPRRERPPKPTPGLLPRQPQAAGASGGSEPAPPR